MSYAEAVVRVSRGIKRLDQFGPGGWRSRVDLSKLAMHDAFDCVLGQIYTDHRRKQQRNLPYYLGLEALELDRVDAVLHGFFADSEVGDSELEAAWRERLAP